MKAVHSLRAVAAAAALAAAPAASADVPADAALRAAEIIGAAKLPHNGLNYRAMAIVEVSAYEAVNAVTGKFPAGRVKLERAKGASVEAALASATRAALAALAPSQAQAIQASYEAALAGIPEGASKAAGIAVGERSAAAVLALRAADGWDIAETYRPAAAPGQYVPTPVPLMSEWGRRKPWVLASPDQFRPPPPPALSSEVWARDHQEIRRMGARSGSARTAEQTTAARYWEGSGPAMYVVVVRSALQGAGREVTESTRLLATAAMAMDDALVAVMDAKWTYRFWRPITAIRNADQDGNDATVRDASWLPLIDTPQHPEYPCAHCIVAGAVAAVLEAGFAGGSIPALSGTSPALPGVTRTWATPADLVKEVSEARICDGVHYRTSTEVGAAMGRKIGALAAEHELKLAANR